MELIIYNPQIPELIKFNNAELIAELTEKLGHYNNLTYTDTEIKTAKTDRATLRKFKEAIEERRKEIKVDCMKPYNDFDTKVKEIVNLIDKPIIAIDIQVKTYEQKVKAEKKAEIIAFYNETIGELVELVPIEKVWIDKWLTIAEKMKSIKEDIILVLDKTRSDLLIISGLQSDFEMQVREVYLKGLNLGAALQEKTRLDDQKAKQESYNKAQEEKREQSRVYAEEQATLRAERVEAARLLKEEADRKHAEEIAIVPEVIEPIVETVIEPEPVAVMEIAEEVVPEIIPEVVQPQEVEISFKAWVTPDLLEALEEFMQAYEIKYERTI